MICTAHRVRSIGSIGMTNKGGTSVNEEIIFTPAALLDLLNQIDELKGLNLGLTETLDGDIQLQVGDSTYIINTSSEETPDVDVSEDVVETVSNLNEDAYSELEASGNVELDESVESGLIGELAKTLFVGGVARLTAKILKDKK